MLSKAGSLKLNKVVPCVAGHSEVLMFLLPLFLVQYGGLDFVIFRHVRKRKQKTVTL